MGEASDRHFLELVRQAIVPPGHRPEKDADINAMLQACANSSITDEKLQRMLKKIKGELPVGKRASVDAADLAEFEKTLTEEQRELVALHKSQGTEMPSEIRMLLQQFRKQAAEEGDGQPPSGDTNDGKS